MAAKHKCGRDPVRRVLREEARTLAIIAVIVIIYLGAKAWL